MFKKALVFLVDISISRFKNGLKPDFCIVTQVDKVFP